MEVDNKGVLTDGSEPVALNEEDFKEVGEIQALAEGLNHVRQEIGRLYQVISGLREKADETEVELATKRRDLAAKYDLRTGQWSLDFETKEFKKLSSDAPTIP